jgi:hypothetical protein
LRSVIESRSASQRRVLDHHVVDPPRWLDLAAGEATPGQERFAHRRRLRCERVTVVMPDLQCERHQRERGART